MAPLIPATSIPKASGKNTMNDRSFFNPAGNPYDAYTIPWRRAEIGGSNGHGNARGVAIAQAVLANGGAFESGCSPSAAASASSKCRRTGRT